MASSPRVDDLRLASSRQHPFQLAFVVEYQRCAIRGPDRSRKLELGVAYRRKRTLRAVSGRNGDGFESAI